MGASEIPGWPKVRKYVRDNFPSVCWLCGEWIDKSLPAKHPKSFSVDHIIPVSKGGDPTSLDNVAPAHYGCNSSRGNREPEFKRSDIDW